MKVMLKLKTDKNNKICIKSRQIFMFNKLINLANGLLDKLGSLTT